tara:strand:+ start:37567 stop:38814 length:1248 start_codon:yes stop_codon:yes gene_type:complete
MNTGRLISGLKNMRNNNNFTSIISVILILIVITVLYKGYTYIKNKSKNNPFLVKGPKDATEFKELDGSTLIQSPLGVELTYSFWIYVADWNYKYAKPKHIFHVGDEEGKAAGPSVWLYPNSNSLYIRFNTYDRVNNVSKTISGTECQNWNANLPHKIDSKYTDMTDVGIGNHNYCRNPEKEDSAWCYTINPNIEKEECNLVDHKDPPHMNPILNPEQLNVEKMCDISNIPVQRWVHIGIVLVNKTVDIYLNGSLNRSCILDNIPILNKGNIYINQYGGFKGTLSDLLYQNHALSSYEIYKLYKAGHNTFDLAAAAFSAIPKVKLNVNIDIGGGSLIEARYYDGEDVVLESYSVSTGWYTRTTLYNKVVGPAKSQNPKLTDKELHDSLSLPWLNMKMSGSKKPKKISKADEKLLSA